jgi:predicted HAD superfamily Cof-like phosphohydrolase
MTKMSHTDKVKQFTEESMGTKLPRTPSPLTKGEVVFITRMVASELLELITTVTDTVDEAQLMLQECIGSLDVPKQVPRFGSEEELIAEQYDAFVDAWYYMLNTSVKKGVNLDGLFDVVHEANMRKRWADGKFHRREDGKVVKPEGWKEPDLVSEIKKQMQQ